MGHAKLSPGDNAPFEVNAVIEISKGSGAVKYEIDHKTGLLAVDRLRGPLMPYPENYGYIPATLGEDGDPLDILVLSDEAILTGAMMCARPVGVLKMCDEKGIDHKIIAVPGKSLTRSFDHIQNVSDLPEKQREALEFHFKHYKTMESAAGRYALVEGWDDAPEAFQIISEGILRAQVQDEVDVIVFNSALSSRELAAARSAM